MTDRPLIGPEAAWITYYNDENCGHIVVTGVYDDELQALRHANASRERAALIPYGKDPQTANETMDV